MRVFFPADFFLTAVAIVGLLCDQMGGSERQLYAGCRFEEVRSISNSKPLAFGGEPPGHRLISNGRGFLNSGVFGTALKRA